MAVPTGRISFQEVANGSAITNSNTTPTLSTSTGGAGSSRTASTADAYVTGRGALIVGNGVSSYFAKIFTSAVDAAGVTIYLHYLTAEKPSADITILQLRNSGGTSFSCSLLTTGKLRTNNAAGGTVDSTAINGDAELTDDHWYMIQISSDPGTGTTDGTGIFRLYDMTADPDGLLINTITKSNINTGTTQLTECRWGKTGGTGNYTCRCDEIAWLESSTSGIDLVTQNVTYDIQIDDPVGISDTGAPQQMSVEIPWNDAVGIADSLTNALNKPLGDNSGITDSLSLSFEKALADPVGITDGMTVSSDRTVATDQVNITDQLNAIQGSGTSQDITDSVGITDAISLTRTINITIADSLGIHDALLGVVPSGEGSIYDIEGARLRALGYSGSLAEMLSKWYCDQLSLAYPQALSVQDLEYRYLTGLGYTGSIGEMRRDSNRPKLY